MGASAAHELRGKSRIVAARAWEVRQAMLPLPHFLAPRHFQHSFREPRALDLNLGCGSFDLVQIFGR